MKQRSCLESTSSTKCRRRKRSRGDEDKDRIILNGRLESSVSVENRRPKQQQHARGTLSAHDDDDDDDNFGRRERAACKRRRGRRRRYNLQPHIVPINMPLTCLLITMCCMVSFTTAKSSIPQRKNSMEDFYNSDDDCSLYLAPSSIPGAGLGMYAGSKRYKEGDAMADPDLMVPVYELDWHSGDFPYSFLWDEYTWSATMFPGLEDEVEDALQEANVVSPGFGAAINCMIPLVNVVDEPSDGKAGDSAYQLTLSGISSNSPGAGAFTPMTGRVFVASKDIAPYSELYADYGNNYFTGRDSYQSVPLEQHYDLADQLVKRYQKKLLRLRMLAAANAVKDLSSNTSRLEMLRIMENDENEKVVDEDEYAHATPTTKPKQHVSNTLEFEHDFYNFMMDTRDIWKESRLLHALPGRNTTLSFLNNLMDFGGTAMQHYNETVKSQEWMQEHGQCMDRIMDGVSTIEHAGRGAFARRRIRKGDLVSPAPIVHIPNKTALTMYEIMINEEGQHRRDVTKPYSMQLLLNYCFGHADSTVLLCPYGLLNFLINHSHEKPNARIQWSRRQRHAEWLEQPVDEWGKKFHNGLSMDFVALRDIEEGEEITIDYGWEWEQAWQAHLMEFEPPRPHYMPAFELNWKLKELEEDVDGELDYSDLVLLPTYYEMDKQWDDVILFCRDEYFPEVDVDIKPYKFGFTDEEEYGNYYKCRILVRNDEANSYIAEVVEHESWIENRYIDREETWEDTPKLLLLDVPRHAFFYRDVPSKRDHHQFWSFRHDMRIPDDMFPEVWKNLKANSADATTSGSDEL